ncbi:MAG TPA: glycosyltransferase, partial [Pyrinomonadaceae bacterium]|nr:glycosyltransferase [Pyrinomonadaceae bacterium]
LDSVTLAHLNQFKRDARLKVLTCAGPFSSSAIYNFGRQHAEGAVIGFIDSDLRIVSSDWLREMASHALRPEVGAVGALIFDENDSIQRAGIILGVRGGVGHAFKGFPTDSEGYVFRAQVIQNYSAVSGDCLVMRKDVFDEIGGFDEETFPSTFNDVDLCLRIRRRGCRLLWTPYAKLNRRTLSIVGLAAKDKAEHERVVRNFQSRWSEVLAADPYYNLNLGLESEDFSLASPPRARKPWKDPAEHHGP